MPFEATGFCDGEASFKILVQRNKNYKNGYSVSLRFSILLHEKDLDLLKRIPKYFGVGIISKQNYNAVDFNVNSIDHLMVIINHFNKYPLLTSKPQDLKLWSLAKIISNKEHFTEQGLSLIVALKSTLNRGLPLALQAALPDIVQEYLDVDNSIIRPSNLNPYWLGGFSEALSFFIRIVKSTKMRLATQFFK